MKGLFFWSAVLLLPKPHKKNTAELLGVNSGKYETHTQRILVSISIRIQVTYTETQSSIKYRDFRNAYCGNMTRPQVERFFQLR